MANVKLIKFLDLHIVNSRGKRKILLTNCIQVDKDQNRNRISCRCNLLFLYLIVRQLYDASNHCATFCKLGSKKLFLQHTKNTQKKIFYVCS